MIHIYKIFIGNLPESVNEEDLKSLCSKFGIRDVTEVSILRASDGRSRRCGFISLSNMLSCEAAIVKLDQAAPFPGGFPLRASLAKRGKGR